MISDRRVAIVTGANTGVGYSIVQRLVQESPEPLTVILACRNKGRAQEALASLQDYFQALQHKQQQDQEKNHRTSSFKEDNNNNNTPRIHHYPELKIELVDVGSVASVLAFNKRILEHYPRVDYLFCNAGVLPSAGLMWSKLVLDIFRAPMDVVVRSDVLIQPKQHLTEDGIGNVLACNVFGHYLMIKGLEDVLSKTEEDPGRVIWTSSMTAEKASFSSEDWQGLEATQPYESSKWVTDLLAIRLNEVWAGQQPSGSSSTSASAVATDMLSVTAAGTNDLSSGIPSGSSSDAESSNNSRATTPTRRVTRSTSKASLGGTPNAHDESIVSRPRKHIISIATQPGVVASGIGGLAAWIVMMRIVLHCVLRFCGERNQTITGYHGAQSNIYAALERPVQKIDYRSKYGSCVRRMGQEYLRVEKVVEYEETQANMVVEELEKLRLSLAPSS